MLSPFVVNIRLAYEGILTQLAAKAKQVKWLGNGDPSMEVEPDPEPLITEDMELFINRLEGMRRMLAHQWEHPAEIKEWLDN